MWIKKNYKNLQVKRSQDNILRSLQLLRLLQGTELTGQFWSCYTADTNIHSYVLVVCYMKVHNSSKIYDRVLTAFADDLRRTSSSRSPDGSGPKVNARLLLTMFIRVSARSVTNYTGERIRVGVGGQNVHD